MMEPACIAEPHSAAREAPVFCVVDEGSSRSDLAMRREVKYLLPRADVAKLRRLLESNCRRLIHNGRVSAVRSVYFDDPRLSACRANLAGLSRRRKVRLRWYDALRPDRRFFFEIKWRHGCVTGKHRLQMESDRPLHCLPYRHIVDGLLDSLPPRYVGDVVAYSQPVMIVQYQREHFASDDGCLRVTLDYDLAYYDQTGKRLMATAFVRRLDDLVVLEGKSPVGRESELRRLFHPFAPRMGSCSKYVHGCRLLGLVPAG